MSDVQNSALNSLVGPVPQYLASKAQEYAPKVQQEVASIGNLLANRVNQAKDSFTEFSQENPTAAFLICPAAAAAANYPEETEKVVTEAAKAATGQYGLIGKVVDWFNK